VTHSAETYSPQIPNPGAPLNPVSSDETQHKPPEELGISTSAPLLLAIGNLYPVKGHRHLISALSILGRSHPQTHLAIAGRGDLLPELEGLAANLGVADRVHFLGLRADVPQLLASADIFVLPSVSEGLPRLSS
jgi:glycosyltransferase involved in cell wall biosynthesis